MRLTEASVCIAVVLGGVQSHTRTRVGIYNGDSLFAGLVLKKPLFGAVVTRAGQAGQVDEHGHLVQRVECRLRREVEVECHLAVGRRRIVREFQQLAAEGGDRRCCADGHFCVVWLGGVVVVVLGF